MAVVSSSLLASKRHIRGHDLFWWIHTQLVSLFHLSDLEVHRSVKKPHLFIPHPFERPNIFQYDYIINDVCYDHKVL